MVTSLALFTAMVVAQPEPVKTYKVDAGLAKEAANAARKAIAFYRANQFEDGSFATGDFGPPITGLAVAGMLRSRQVTMVDPMIAKALAFLEKNVREDGGIYNKGSGQRNYSTAICVLAFVEANKDGQYKQVIDKAVSFLKKEQWDESESIDEKDARFGGAGYGGANKTRPDLSNTAFLLEALNAAGLPKDDPAYQRALVFVRRCQNNSEEGGNDLPFAKLTNDGGFVYTPVENYNPGGGTIDQGLRSYGSMTYAGLKSFIAAGLTKDDPRVQAALGWIKQHYTLEENPGVGQQGLYYYYHTFAKALDVLDLPALVDAKGQSHSWREDLLKTLIAKQQKDGSWMNPEKRWLENDARLTTAYVLLAIAHAVE